MFNLISAIGDVLAGKGVLQVGCRLLMAGGKVWTGVFVWSRCGSGDDEGVGWRWWWEWAEVTGHVCEVEGDGQSSLTLGVVRFDWGLTSGFNKRGDSLSFGWAWL